MRTTPQPLIEEYRRTGWWSETRVTDLFDAAVESNPDGLAVVMEAATPTTSAIARASTLAP